MNSLHFERPTNDADDETLAQLERQAESGSRSELAPSSRTENRADNRTLEAVAEHYRLYNLIEHLAAPVRLALAADDSPPQLPEYESLEEIGRGGMGVVYRGLHRKLRRLDAIKVIRPDRLADINPESVRQMQYRFERELRLASYVAHEHIVPVYQVGEVDGRPWFSMQFVEGVSLQELRANGMVAPEHLAVVMEKIARAVNTVHRHGVLHGDIKPHNILIERETNRPLITDFGLAEFDLCFDLKCDEILAESASDNIAGTPAYMAPELLHAAIQQASPQEVALVRSVLSDVYSLGATLWATLTGRSPLEFRDAQVAVDSRSGKLPPELLRICQKSMSENPALRHQSAQEFADELAQWLNRPRWNQYFPGLRNLLWMIVAPCLLISNLIVWILMREQAAEFWIWSIIFTGYVPLFAVFFRSQRIHLASNSARRELWSIWIGHAIGAVASMISLRLLLAQDLSRMILAFYCAWAAITSVVLFAKSGNFWTAYRWIGIAWSGIAVSMALMPEISPILFGCAAALTCIVIARGDEAFASDEHSSSP